MKARLYLVLISLMLSCCVSQPNTQLFNIYNICIDHSFSEFENLLIKDQFKLWQQKINNKVAFKFKDNCNVDVKSFIANQSDIMVLNFDQPNDYIYELDKDQDPGMLTIGVYHNKTIKFIGLITYRITNYDKFKKVTLHEIGHLLGLNHGKKNTIMYKHVSDQTGDLTDDDIKEFCNIYKC